MNWASGVVLYVIIWWVVLFAVLPVGTRPRQGADETSGWRGTPAKPMMPRKILATTVIAAALWVGAYFIIQSDYFSFRHGILAPRFD